MPLGSVEESTVIPARELGGENAAVTDPMPSEVAYALELIYADGWRIRGAARAAGTTVEEVHKWMHTEGESVENGNAQSTTDLIPSRRNGSSQEDSSQEEEGTSDAGNS